MIAGRDKINWNEQFKFRISNSDTSRQKHEVIKLLLMMKIIEKHKKEKSWIRVYSEFPIDSQITDIYYESLKDKSVVCYEVQKEFNSEYVQRITEAYNKIDIPYFTVDLVIIPIRESPKDLDELNKWLDKFIV
jgi:hypothetical protein